MYPEIPLLSFVFTFLTLVPLIWYLHARNFPAVAIGIWLSVVNLTYAVNAFIWAKDTAPGIGASVWCDVSTCFITGSRAALPAACLSICIHLQRLASCQTSTPRLKRRSECLMCFGLPLVYIALHLVVQPRRFDLFHGFGCRPATYPTITSIFLVMIPPLLLTVATIICGGIAWRHFLVYNDQFHGKKGSISSLTRNWYHRLVGMAILEAIFSAVLITTVMWGVLSPGLAPIGTMSRDLSEVLTRGPEAITGTVRTVLEIEWSVTVVQSMVFFGMFACRMEVARKAWGMIRSFPRLSRPSVLSRRSKSEKSSTSSVPTLPITVVDLSLVIQTASTLAQYTDKSLSSSRGPSDLPSLVEDAPEGIPVAPLGSPSRASAIALSHNSLEPHFDTSWSVARTSVPRSSFDVGLHFPREVLQPTSDMTDFR